MEETVYLKLKSDKYVITGPAFRYLKLVFSRSLVLPKESELVGSISDDESTPQSPEREPTSSTSLNVVSRLPDIGTVTFLCPVVPAFCRQEERSTLLLRSKKCFRRDCVSYT